MGADDQALCIVVCTSYEQAGSRNLELLEFIIKIPAAKLQSNFHAANDNLKRAIKAAAAEDESRGG